MPMRTRLRKIAFIATLVVISPRAVALGQTVQCPNPRSIGASTDLPPAADGDVARAEDILRDWLVCGLAREVDSAPPDEVRLIRGYLMEVFEALDTERLLGSRPAAALLEDPGIRSLINQLKALDSPESREPGR